MQFVRIRTREIEMRTIIRRFCVLFDVSVQNCSFLCRRDVFRELDVENKNKNRFQFFIRHRSTQLFSLLFYHTSYVTKVLLVFFILIPTRRNRSHLRCHHVILNLIGIRSCLGTSYTLQNAVARHSNYPLYPANVCFQAL